MLKNYFSLSLLALALVACSGGGEVVQKPVKGICKSCKPYYVRGSWHYPQNHYHYEEVGLASWYGPGFHGKPKPYGELFDQNALTAAHKTLPLPTVVLVENLENGRSLKLIVDDRGPFVYDGRIIDLSMAAAKALGCYYKGTAKVRVTALVDESDELSRHLEARYGRSGRDPGGRAWWHIYQHEIAPKYANQYPIEPASVSALATPDLSSLSVDSASDDAFALKAKTANQALSQVLKNLERPLPQKSLKAQPIAPLVSQPIALSKNRAKASPVVNKFYVILQQQFVQKGNAQALLERLGLSYPAKIIEVSSPTVPSTPPFKNQKFYMVSIGPFNDSAAAQTVLKKLIQKGYLSKLVRRL